MSSGLDLVAGPRLELLGGFQLRSCGEVLAVPPRVQRLLAFMALQRRPLHRAYVAGRLWLDLSQDQAHGCLRTALWRAAALRAPVVAATATHVSLAPALEVDVHELERCAERALHDKAPPDRGDLRRLVRASDLVPDWYDDWAIQERERLRQLRLLALEAAGAALIRDRRYSDASLAALAALDADPLRESACRLLMRSYMAAGNCAEAIRQFRVYRGRLQTSLGLEPTAEMRALVRELVA